MEHLAFPSISLPHTLSRTLGNCLLSFLVSDLLYTRRQWNVFLTRVLLYFEVRTVYLAVAIFITCVTRLLYLSQSDAR
jgi:hypothetical protein